MRRAFRTALGTLFLLFGGLGLLEQTHVVPEKPDMSLVLWFVCLSMGAGFLAWDRR